MTEREFSQSLPHQAHQDLLEVKSVTGRSDAGSQ